MTNGELILLWLLLFRPLGKWGGTFFIRVWFSFIFFEKSMNIVQFRLLYVPMIFFFVFFKEKVLKFVLAQIYFFTVQLMISF